MLAHYRRPVCLSLISTDLAILSSFETAATLYKKDQQKYHILLTQPGIVAHDHTPCDNLLWLEISPYRVIMTMQGKGNKSYRHFWEQGVYGISRYWLQDKINSDIGCIRLRNYTRSLKLKGSSFPESLRVEYELWADTIQLGHYVLHLEIRH